MGKKLFFFFIFSILGFLGEVSQAASNTSVVYQARILKPDGTSLESLVNFQIVVRSPNNCILWAETQAVDMTGTKGAVILRVGEGTSTLTSGTHGFNKVFQNSETVYGLAGCSSGSDYSPVNDDDRIVQVSFNDGTGAQSIPNMVIKNVPFAAESSSTLALRGKSLSNTAPTNGQILRFNAVLDQWEAATGSMGTVTGVGLTLPSIFTVTSPTITSSGTLSATLANQGANLIFAGPGSGATAPPSFRALVADDIPLISAGKINSGTLAVGNGGTGINGSSAANGQLLIGTGAGFALGTLTAGSNVTISNQAGGITISALLNSGTIGLANGGTGLDASGAANGQLLIGNGSGFSLSSLSGSNGVVINNLVGGVNLSTNAQASNAINTIVSRDGSGNFESAQATLTSLRLNNAGSFVTLSTPMGANYSMMLPPDMGTAGQFLRTNGTNSLSWFSFSASDISSGTLSTSVVGTLPFTSISGTISLAQRGPIDGSSVTNIAGSSITSGTIDLARIGSVPFPQVSGTISIAQVGALPFSSLNGTISLA